jgi:hypothetical protein
MIAALAKGRDYSSFPRSGVSWFYKVVPTELRDSVFNCRQPIIAVSFPHTLLTKSTEYAYGRKKIQNPILFK